ncbi:MAG: hypothetical protein B9S30_02440 [Verrucomicrobiia bacterium Tous-C5FEB]|nr:MAG: hypothetical protein B9S30_02440 [Verrucomicrobiae bacterium Tous-C5FEB]
MASSEPLGRFFKSLARGSTIFTFGPQKGLGIFNLGILANDTFFNVVVMADLRPAWSLVDWVSRDAHATMPRVKVMVRKN